MPFCLVGLQYDIHFRFVKLKIPNRYFTLLIITDINS